MFAVAFLCICSVAFASPLWQTQAKALLALYDATTGDRWRSPWNASILRAPNDAAAWCAFSGIQCGEEHAVTALVLNDAGLDGDWPRAASSGLLSTLQMLNVAHNVALGGSLDDVVGAVCRNMTCGLTSLDVSYTALSSDLDSLQLTTSLPNLTSLALGPNRLLRTHNATKWLQNVLSLPHLTNLHVRGPVQFANA